MIIPWWGIFIGLAVFAMLIVKVFHLLYRIEKLEELVRRLEGIDEERLREEEKEESPRKKKSLLELDDIDERRDSGGG